MSYSSLRIAALAAFAALLTTPVLAQSVTTATGDPSRPAVVIVPSTGRSYPDSQGANAQAYGMVLLDPSTGTARGSAANPIYTSSSGGGGGSAVYGPTAVGTAAANPPVLTGGTSDGTGTGTVGVQQCAGGLCSVKIYGATGTAVTQGTGVAGANSLNVAATVTQPLPAGTNAIGSITNTSFGATQSGTWTVQPGNTANTTPWLTTAYGSNGGAIKTTTGDALEPVTAASGKITSTAISASGQTPLVAANANRIGFSAQCAAACKISETGATMTSAAMVSGEGGVVLSAGAYFIPPVASRTAYTVYSTGLVTYTDYSR